MRVGLVCPYAWDTPGGVGFHIRDLAEQLTQMDHYVSVLSPVDDDASDLPPYVVPAGHSVPIRYNGSVSRLLFGPVAASRARRWLRDEHFDVIHLHSPETFSLSLLTLMMAKDPIVATFHASTTYSRILALLRPGLQPQLEKIRGRIAVSAAARRTIVSHLGGDAVVIPNGVYVDRFRNAKPLAGFERSFEPGRARIGFLGRIDEPRKGLPVLLAAFAGIAERFPEASLLIAGPGQAPEIDMLPPPLRARITLLGRISEQDKRSFFKSCDIYVAPNTGGESFGIILVEAFSGGTPVIASDLDAFRQVLDEGRAGRTFRTEDSADLETALADLIEKPELRREYSSYASQIVRQYDWPVVASRIVEVYRTVIGSETGQ